MAKSKKHKPNNLVAKHCNEFNKPATHVDRKKRIKSGYKKHNKKVTEDD